MRIAKISLIALAALLATGVSIVAYSSMSTESEIGGHRERVELIALKSASPVYDPVKIAALPEPVQRYFKFTFVEPHRPVTLVKVTMAGDFRRPLAEKFEPTTAEQTIAVGSPNYIFSATTPIFFGVWARVYDAFFESEMVMKAKLASTITIVDERETPELNLISLRRWLLESPLFPAALLPGGYVKWEAIDSTHARAVVSHGKLETSLVATFREDGSLATFDAEKDGDLNTPYHGSGEHTLRGDYQLVSGIMIPHSFTIARAAGGKTYPFWTGRITSIDIEKEK